MIIEVEQTRQFAFFRVILTIVFYTNSLRENTQTRNPLALIKSLHCKISKLLKPEVFFIPSPKFIHGDLANKVIPASNKETLPFLWKLV